MKHKIFLLMILVFIILILNNVFGENYDEYEPYDEIIATYNGTEGILGIYFHHSIQYDVRPYFKIYNNNLSLVWEDMYSDYYKSLSITSYDDVVFVTMYISIANELLLLKFNLSNLSSNNIKEFKVICEYNGPYEYPVSIFLNNSFIITSCKDNIFKGTNSDSLKEIVIERNNYYTTNFEYLFYKEKIDEIIGCDNLPNYDFCFNLSLPIIKLNSSQKNIIQKDICIPISELCKDKGISYINEYLLNNSYADATIFEYKEVNEKNEVPEFSIYGIVIILGVFVLSLYYTKNK